MLLEGSSLDLIQPSFIFLLLISFYLFSFDIKRFLYISFQTFCLDFILNMYIYFIFNIFFSFAGTIFFLEFLSQFLLGDEPDHHGF